MENNRFSRKISVFHNRPDPESGTLAGNGALIDVYDLEVPVPDKLSLISTKHRKYSTDSWELFPLRYLPEDSLMGHLTFALKYEGIDLYILKCVFREVPANEIRKIILASPMRYYSRRIWFLYEWLMDVTLDIPDLKAGNYIHVLDEKLQYPGPVVNIPRYRVRNNLSGVKTSAR